MDGDTMHRAAIGIGIGALVGAALAAYVSLHRIGQRVALRDPLRPADVIVAVAGTRGNIAYLDAKIRTAVRLYSDGWAPCILFSGRFSRKVGDRFKPIPLDELEQAVAQERIDPSHLPSARETWDAALGANYMRERAIALGVPADRIITEEQSLHTRENAAFTASIVVEHSMKRIILVASPFHQLRTYRAFREALPQGTVEITNYHAETSEWHPTWWFLSASARQLVTGELRRIRKYHPLEAAPPSNSIPTDKNDHIHEQR
jgi:uncharacterized SAM-binding protein YcdF (DUF218 family)